MHRIYVTSTIPDARTKVKKQQFTDLGLKHKLGEVYLAECYTIDAKLNKKQLVKACQLLANPLSQLTTHYPLPTTDSFSYAIEIGYLPGVTDNIGHTAKETLADGAKIKFKPEQNVYFSQVFFISFNDPTPSPRFAGYSPSAMGRGSADIQKIATSLYNPLIQRASIKTFSEYQKDGGMDLIVPKVKLTSGSKVSLVDLNVGDEELERLGKLGVADEADKSARYNSSVARPFMGLRRGPLALSLEELKAIRVYFNALKRKPTDIELETLAQTWSEHCKHTIFCDPMDELKNGIYKTYIKAATEAIRKQKGEQDFCVSVFTDNAGGIVFDKDNIIAHKVETHNTPSALDPFGGAITGIVGVNRDALGFGLGAKPVANFFGFCLASPDNKTELYRSKPVGTTSLSAEALAKLDGRQKNGGQWTPLQHNEQKMLSARRIMDGVIAGINSGGNQSGIPTPLGFLYFDDSYRGKPLVFAGTLGLLPKKIGRKKAWEKQAKPGDLIVMVGGRVGVDGIHGATFSSEGLDSHSPATAVQIGDPITQKKFSDAICKEARDLNLYNSITDCGAGGLSSAVGEMAQSSNGCEVNLDKVPLKYPGLQPWQTWVSESQERMILAIPQKKWKKFEKLMKTRDVEATAIGKFTRNGKCVVKYNGKKVLDIDLNFFHNGRPKKQLVTKRSVPIYRRSQTPINGHATELKSLILNLLSSPNITSTEFVNQQYDHEVQGSSVQKPLQGRGKVNSEAAVIRPVLSSQKGVVLSSGLYPHLSDIDPYQMAACSIDSAIRAAVAAGADIDYLALLDNFCWCSPQDPHRLWQLKEAARACFETAVDFGTPFISGKDSMHNDFKGFGSDGKPVKISILPTLLISAVGVIPDIEKTVSLDAKIPGDIIYILGETNNELAGSEFAQMITGVAAASGRQKNGGQWPPLQTGNVPQVNALKNHRLYKSVFNSNQRSLISSAISINRGGLAIALAKKLIGGRLGATVNLANVPGAWQENYEALFSESQGRILVSVDPKKTQEFEKLMTGNTIGKIGKVTDKSELIIKDRADKKILSLNLNQAEKAYKKTFKNY